MTLPTTNISVNAIAAELGITQSVSRTWTYLTSYSGINKYARFAPGALSVDGSKNTVVTPPASNMKLGDFRSYNHASNTPSLSPPSQLNYGPGAGNISVVIGFLVETMNVWSYADPADVSSYKLYDNATDRGNEANPYQHTGLDSISITSLSFSTVPPPTGHSRTSDKVAGGTQPSSAKSFNSSTNGFSPPNQTVYGDGFLGAFTTGARKINMADAVSDGYFTFVAHENQAPYVTATGNITPAPTTPGTWTAAWIAVHTNSTSCDFTSQITQTWNGTTYSFYIKILGIYSSSDYRINTTDCNVYLTHDGGKQLIHSGALSENGIQVSGTLDASNTWSYDEIGYVTIEDVVWGTNDTVCP